MKTTSLLICFLFLITFNFFGQGYLVTYPLEPGASVSSNFTVFVNETPVNATKVGLNNDVSFAHFSFAGKVTIRIHVSATVNTYDLSPHSYDIVSSKSGQDISFELDRPRKILLQKVNSIGEDLCILADPLEDNPPKIGDANVVNIMDKGADNTGIKNNLNRINATIAALPSGSILYFPPGLYTAGGTINMLSNKSIYIAGGAVIQGTRASSGGELSFNFDGASNVKLFGRGAIDGNGDLKSASYNGQGGATLLSKADATVSDNCSIDGIILKEAITWSNIIMGTTNWNVYNIKVINGKKYGHDSWDPHNAINMMFDNSFLYTSDDPIAFSTTRKNLNLNITFRNSVFTNTNSGATVRIGPWIADGTSNIKVENNDHLLSGTNEYALAFWVGGALSNVKYLGNRVENARSGGILMRTNWTDYYAGVQDGSVDGVIFDRLIIEKISPYIYDEKHLNQFEGPNSTNFVKNITFKDFYQKGSLITSASAADLYYKGPYVTNVTFDTSTTPVVVINAASLFAYRTGSTSGKFTVSRTGGSTADPLTLKYVIHGTALNGTDYAVIPDSVVIPAGAETTDIIITPDVTNTSDYYKTVFISLSSSVNYMLGPDFHSVVTISNNSVTDIDSQLPSKPANLDSSSVTPTGFRLSWTPSTDNIAIATYQVFKNGVYIATTSDTSYSVTGLSASTDYEFTVKAWDCSGNASDLSDALKITILTTGISECYLSELTIYPNPVEDHTLVLDFNNAMLAKNAGIEITDMNGRVEYETTIQAVKKAKISLPDSLVQGLYILSITVDNTIMTNKIVIK